MYTAEKDAEDELKKPITTESRIETQQTNEPDMVQYEHASSQTQRSDHVVSRAGRVSKLPSHLRDYIKH